MWLIGAGLLMWIGLAIFGPKPKGKTKELYESKVEHFKADSVEDGEGEGAGVFSNVAKSFKRVLNLEPEKKVEAVKRFRADISCVPFGCPDARMAAGFAIEQETGAAFLYGGFDEDREGGFLQDLHYYDTGKFQWKRISGHNGVVDGPGKRVHVRMACANKMLCLFGGSTENSDYSDDLFVMDIGKSPLSWIKVLSGSEDSSSVQPKARYGHAMCTAGPYVVMFGGLGSGEVYLNDMWLLDTQVEAAQGLKWQYVRPGGDYWPKARDSHAICELPGQNKLLLFGGFDGVSERVIPAGTLEVFDFDQGRWSEVVTCGDGPLAGANCSVHALGRSGRFCTVVEQNGGIFNEMHICDTNEDVWQWSELQLDWKGDWTMIPGQRNYFSSCYDELEGICYVFGGKGSGKDGMLHGTLLVVNLKDAAGIKAPEEGGEGEMEEEDDEEAEGEGGGKSFSKDKVKEAMNGMHLPGS
eukprot:CAMPEP_0182482366 /NCGR_PEP_ID=MMETSP1319-20130603/39140_1 /TAXON_ID=172717 /ORGANISM="Bolidomonas pacifica, Strain RCC208" /LENGTH=467 /DNA_ID=CAMNT_0024684077 /DNA_START=53 /DNA_END=1453 /DNA_ORIENTATION=+